MKLVKLFYGVLLFLIFFTLNQAVWAKDFFPMGDNNNFLYYKMGGGSDFALPAVSSTQTIHLNASGDLGSGYSCGAFNPALSISNSLNNLKNESDNLEQSVLNNATGSITEMPMYFLAQANPTLYNLINNALLQAHNALSVSVKSCEAVKNQIAMHQDPYKDWATIAVNDQWKKHLSLTASGDEDINTVKRKIDSNPGQAGVNWVQGVKDSKGNYRAGGKAQPPVHVIADTVKAGYNAMLMRDLTDNSPVNAKTQDDAKNSELAVDFPTPQAAQAWIVNVVGDQIITTCTTVDCIKQQGGVSGRGLLPWITTCEPANQSYCAGTIRASLSDLVVNKSPITQQKLEAVSANGLVISPEIIMALRGMEPVEQSILINKLSQEIATQHVINQALLARTILQTGSQVPVIAANPPALKIIQKALLSLDNDIQSLAFDARVRHEMMSDTLSAVLQDEHQRERDAMQVSPVLSPVSVLKNNALDNKG